MTRRQPLRRGQRQASGIAALLQRHTSCWPTKPTSSMARRFPWKSWKNLARVAGASAGKIRVIKSRHNVVLAAAGCACALMGLREGRIVFDGERPRERRYLKEDYGGE